MSDSFLQGKTAVVTGATRGIGFSIAQALLDAGASVGICGRSASAVDAALKKLKGGASGRVVGTAADVADRTQVTRLFEFVDRELGGLDILINNAGVGVFRSVAELTPEDWHHVLDTNVTGVFYCCHEALPRLKARNRGDIINISSLAGKNPFAGGAAYNASKFALNGFSEAMMLDHRFDGIRVSYIMPGSVDTEFGSHATGAKWKIAPEDISAVVLAILRMPERTTVSRVEIRPSKPAK